MRGMGRFELHLKRLTQADVQKRECRSREEVGKPAKGPHCPGEAMGHWLMAGQVGGQQTVSISKAGPVDC